MSKKNAFLLVISLQIAKELSDIFVKYGYSNPLAYDVYDYIGDIVGLLIGWLMTRNIKND